MKKVETAISDHYHSFEDLLVKEMSNIIYRDGIDGDEVGSDVLE